MHQGSAGIGGSAVDIEIQAENLEHTKNVMMHLIAEHTVDRLLESERDADRDRWFTAEEAREYGFVDEILTDVSAVTPALLSRPVGIASGFGAGIGAGR